ncbi:hypothetical protein JW823_06395 [bacterium]|nr:hypothetical protein [candidate division CSSED10-310 bacterium]
MAGDFACRCLLLVKRVLYERRKFAFYCYCDRQGPGKRHPAIIEYTGYDQIPVPFRSRVLPYRWMNAVYYRFRRGQARLLCVSQDGHHLDAYGWIQDWNPFRRSFKAIADSGTMLGPYWTDPNQRGKGLYGILLGHSLAISSPNQPIIICTTPDNTASRRGIEKAGFQSLGIWEWSRWGMLFSRCRELTDEP